jgi:hypothetical protein
VRDISDGVCEIETAAGRIQATASPGLIAGALASVAIRPERIVLSSVHVDGEGLRGNISDVIYLGNARKYVVRLSDGGDCFALRQANAPALETIDRNVHLSWETPHAIAFSTL